MAFNSGIFARDSRKRDLAAPSARVKSSASRNEKPTENRCSDLLNDECSHFRRGNNYGVECARTQHQRVYLDSRRGRSEPYSSRAYSVADRTASASTVRSVAHKTVMATHGEPGVISRPLAMRVRLVSRTNSSRSRC